MLNALQDKQVRQDKARVLGMHMNRHLSSCRSASNVLYRLYPDDIVDTNHLVRLDSIRYFDCRMRIAEETINRAKFVILLIGGKKFYLLQSALIHIKLTHEMHLSTVKLFSWIIHHLMFNLPTSFTLQVTHWKLNEPFIIETDS